MKHTNSLFSVFFLVFFYLLFIKTCQAEMLTVKGSKVNMRSGPGLTYPIIWEYYDGFPFKVLKKKGKWVKVRDFEKEEGWIHKSYLVNKPSMIVKIKSKGKVNIRSGPGKEFKKVGEAYYGVVFESVKRKSGWEKIRHESGLVGWVKRNLLWGY